MEDKFREAHKLLGEKDWADPEISALREKLIAIFNIPREED